ncbi:hypothetical protein [Teredinibacter franksiae]|uniref:hypothetical protein n=1 Tax=Teredinibacter franksiae TaxID=2761453 RepID=UPI000A0C8882|nr:hypothetical protein [Teredinibacter franksiae]SMF48877.1 hypothetical protein SAMN02745866_03200 [Alteromonadaceae bacterium Bs31]
MRILVAIFLLASNALACDKVDVISENGGEIFVSCEDIVKATDDDIADITYKLIISGQFDNSSDFFIHYTQMPAESPIATYNSRLNTVTFVTTKGAAARQVVLRI